ncbi:MAG: flagellar hook-basal body complex protein FliE [Thioalkalispiraceae bacterium]|jgi:flagellar hook-basal body complex protein FliE
MSNTITPDALLAQMRAMIEQSQGQTIGQTNQVNQASKDSFSELLKSAVDTVHSNQQQAAKLTEAFQKGDPNVQMSEVMVSLQKSNVSFQAMVEVRNRLVSAYQEIMNMQV